MSHKMLRPFIVKMSVLGYFLLGSYIYIYILLLLFCWSPFNPCRNLDGVFIYNIINIYGSNIPT